MILLIMPGSRVRVPRPSADLDHGIHVFAAALISAHHSEVEILGVLRKRLAFGRSQFAPRCTLVAASTTASNPRSPTCGRHDGDRPRDKDQRRICIKCCTEIPRCRGAARHAPWTNSNL